jgi:hypothetical protein
MADKNILRIGALLTFLGLVTLVVGTIYHAAHADPGDSPAAFQDYASSDPWIAAHLGQFIGTILILSAMVTLYQFMARTGQPSGVALLMRLGLVGVIATVAVFGLLQAVDGVTLKFAVDQWAAAPDSEKAVAFRVAEAVRWTEIGIHSYFRIIIGLTLMLYGMGIAWATGFPRWSRWFAAATVLIGVAQMIDGVGVGYHGFSTPATPPMLWTTVSIFVGPLFLLWGLALAVFLWRQANQAAPSRGSVLRVAAERGL